MATTERPTVVGVFADRRQAEAAVEELGRAGVGQEQIGLVVRETPPPAPAGTVEVGAENGAAAGAVTGGILGALLGAAVALTLPGAGPVLAAGILAGVLGGGSLGIAAGGLVGALIGLGFSEEESEFYQGELQSGRALVIVKTEGRSAEVATILRRHGALERAATTSSPVGPTA
jgi:hypothetical protein